MSPLRAWRAVVAPVVLVLLMTGCTRAVSGDGAAAPPETPAGLETFYTQTLGWGNCAPFADAVLESLVYADADLECAYLQVPLDYADPAGATAQIGVMRRPASGERIGSLVVNPGGPGASGIDTIAGDIAPNLGPGRLGTVFDLVGFDPRGVGSSTPAIDCLTDAEWDAERLDRDDDTSPAGIARTEDENRRFAQLCEQRSGGASVLATVGTRDVARDMDVLRAALGDRTLTYLGYSYGTLLGTLYAEMFPRNVRALVLDGAVDPSLSTLDSTSAQGDAFGDAFQAYAADCARSPSCPVGTDAAAAAARLDALLAPLVTTPAPADGGARALSVDDAQIGIDAALYSDSSWPTLTEGLTGLAAGDGTTLLELADSYWGRSGNGTYDNETEAFIAIRCADDERVTDRADLSVAEALDTCAFWPTPPTTAPHVPTAEGLPRTLVVSTTGDPATPYEEGVSLAEYLGAALLSVDGEQHTASFSGNDCVDDIAIAYLIDLVLPTDGTRCRL